MPDRLLKMPGSDNPIASKLCACHATVRLADGVIADSKRAFKVRPAAMVALKTYLAFYPDRVDAIYQHHA